MTLYLDTSALVKLYFDEIGSAEVRHKIQSVRFVATSRLAYVETFAGIGRKVREGALTVGDRGEAVADFLRDWERFFVVQVSDSVCTLAAELAEVHPLRSLDAIHLASALLLRGKTGDAVEFGVFDQRLSRAASAEGLAVVFSID